VIFEKGGPSDKYYIVLKGMIEVYNIVKNNSWVFLGKIGPGKHIGERGLLRD